MLEKQLHSRAHKGAFTLVELLVVIAIISILAGILLPVLSNALTVARQTACANKLKQHHLAFSSYADDWEVYPTLWGWPGGMVPAGSCFYPGDSLNKYYLWSEALMVGGYLPRATSRSSNPMFWCPEKIGSTSIAVRANTGHGDYSLNRVVFDQKFTRPGTLLHPSQMVMECDRPPVDSGATIYLHHGTLSPPAMPEGVDPDAHGKWCNFVYFDGHYRPIGSKEMMSWSYNKLPEWNK